MATKKGTPKTAFARIETSSGRKAIATDERGAMVVGVDAARDIAKSKSDLRSWARGALFAIREAAAYDDVSSYPTRVSEELRTHIFDAPLRRVASKNRHSADQFVIGCVTVIASLARRGLRGVARDALRDAHLTPGDVRSCLTAREADVIRQLFREISRENSRERRNRTTKENA